MEVNDANEMDPAPGSIDSPTLASVLGHIMDTVDEPDDSSRASADLPIDNHEGDQPRRLRKRPSNERGDGDSGEKTKRRRCLKLWEAPMDEDSVEKSSTYVHSCPLCGSVRTGTSSLGQHLASAHDTRLNDVGRWVHCGECGANFACDASWRTHLARANCPQKSMSLRWREKKRANKDESEEEEEEEKEAALVGLDGRSRPMLELKKGRNVGKEDVEAKMRIQRALHAPRAYMEPRPGWLIVHQATDFRCPACNECDFPTIASLVWHQRTAHSMQLSQFETWIRCSGCAKEFASLSSTRQHIKKAAAIARRGAAPVCDWSTTALVWQVEEQSEEADRFRAGLPPVLSSAASTAVVAGAASVSPGVKLEPLDEDASYGGATTSDSARKRRHHQQRVDKSYMLPRPGYVIVRRQQQIVCQACGEGGFATCSSLDHHMRTAHKAGFHQAGMWMHCARCAVDFANMTSTRSHLATGGGEAEPCDWKHIYTCWHEMAGRAEAPGVKMEEGESANDLPGTSAMTVNMHQRNPSTAPKRHRKTYKPPLEDTEGYTIVKRLTDLPCFGCSDRFSTLTTFIWCMQGKHRLYFCDVGAWMECACGRVFTSTTALRTHLREEGAMMGCGMEAVSLCWQQRVGGPETATPTYRGAPEPHLVVRYRQRPQGYGSRLMPLPAVPPVARVVSAPTAHASTAYGSANPQPPAGSNLADLLPGFGTRFRQASPSELGNLAPDATQQATLKMGETSLPGNHNDFTDDANLKTLKIEEDEEEELSPLSVEQSGDVEGGRGWREEGRRGMATFDPTGHADGDRFVLRKTAEMACRTCGELSDTPRDLSTHLRTVHPEEMRGESRDWLQLQYLECAACHTVFHSVVDHEQHLEYAEACSMADARLCWMEKEERQNGTNHAFDGDFKEEPIDEDYETV